MAELAPAVWQTLQAAHEARVDVWTKPVLVRAAHRQKHPVDDFLFEYYRHSPGRLRTWSPGLGVTLLDHPATGRWLADGTLEPPSERVRGTAARTVDLLEKTAGRAGRFDCFGLHEWAMVHRSTDVRHDLPLRLGRAGTDTVVESLPLRCTHVDAYRFFTPSAAGLNAFVPNRGTQREHEQPGCLHATMDLYKGAFQLSPWVPSELVADAFALARRVRLLDMRAGPYDLTSFGHESVRVETADGRAEYVRRQRAFSEEAVPLRARLLVAARLVASA